MECKNYEAKLRSDAKKIFPFGKKERYAYGTYICKKETKKKQKEKSLTIGGAARRPSN